MAWLFQRERKECKIEGVEHVSREWIKYVYLDKPITRVTSLEEGRDEGEKWSVGGEYTYISRTDLELIQVTFQCWSSGAVCLVKQGLCGSSGYSVTWYGGVLFGIGWSCLHCGPRDGISEAQPWRWWEERWRYPQSFLHDLVSQITTLERSSLSCRLRGDCLATPLPWGFGWNLNSYYVHPDTREAPPDMRPWLVLSCAANLQGRRLVSLAVHCTPDLPLKPELAPFRPRCMNREAGPSLKMGSAVRDPLTCSYRWDPSLSQSKVFSVFPDTVLHFPTCPFSSLCLSAERDPSPSCLCSRFYLPQFTIIHLCSLKLFCFLPGRLSLFSSQTFGVQSPLASALLCLGDVGSMDPPNSLSWWPNWNMGLLISGSWFQAPCWV